MAKETAVLATSLILACAVVTSSALAACPDFAPAQNLAVRQNPNGIAVGDFNGDGRRDLAVANVSSANLAILIANGTGTFAAPVYYAAGAGPIAVISGDWNGDGKADLAVANYTAGTISILIGRGDGTFAAPVAYAVGTSPMALATGDFNGDGKPDLVVGNGGSNSISVLIGRGDGTFSSAVNYPALGSAQSVAVGDFNRDGRPDIVVGTSVRVGFFAGRGDGTFAARTDWPAGGSARAVVAGDFNRDGKLDVAVANDLTSTVSVLSGNGDGTFAGPAQFAVGGSGPVSIVAADLDSDGALDLVTTNQNSNNASVLRGRGDGTFASPLVYATGSVPRAVVAADFNGDGQPDLATANQGLNNVSILLSTGTCSLTCGQFAPAVRYSGRLHANAFAVADFNGDGKLDVAVATSGGIRIMLGRGDGTFSLGGNFFAGTTSSSMAVGDFNRDGKVDLAVANSYAGDPSVSVLFGNGDGTFAAPVYYRVGGAPTSIVTGDFNGDGKLDLAFASYDFSNQIAVMLGNGDGSFGAPVRYGTGGVLPFAIAAGDFNRDGKLDLAVTNLRDSSVSIFLGRGDGTMVFANRYNVAGSSSIAVADFNGDGKPDILTAASTAYCVLLGNGDGSFRSTCNGTANSESASVAVADFNRDGIPDFAVARNTYGVTTLAVALGNGDGTFAKAARYGDLSYAPNSVASGDFNGDGKPDLIAGVGGVDGAWVFIGTCPLPPNVSVSFGAPSIPLNSTTSLTFTVANPNPLMPLSGVGFADTLPSGLSVATPNGLSSSCGGGTMTAAAGSRSVTLSSAGIAPSKTCTASINVIGTTAGAMTNTAGGVTSNEGGSGASASTTITVVAPPHIGTAFSPIRVAPNAQTTSTFLISNPNLTATLTGVGFTDNLPAGLTVASPSNVSGSCGGGTITAAPGAASITLTGATLQPSESCIFSIGITVGAAGQMINTTGNIVSAEGGAGDAASAAVFGGLGAAPVPVIASIEPSTGTPDGGTVQINGSNLDQAVLVTFDSVSVPILSDSPTGITVISPPHELGPVDVVITTPFGEVTSSGGYVYVEPRERSVSH